MYMVSDKAHKLREKLFNLMEKIYNVDSIRTVLTSDIVLYWQKLYWTNMIMLEFNYINFEE